MNLSRKQWTDIFVTFAVFAAVWGLFEVIAQMGGLGGFFKENSSPWWYISLAAATAFGRVLMHRSFNRGVEAGKASSQG